MGKILASGADMVFLGGIFDNNGGQLVKDKGRRARPETAARSSSWPRTAFTGYPDFLKLTEGR